MKKVFLLFLIVLTVLWLYQISRSRTFQFFGEIIPSMDTNEKVVALTFDDGPSKETDKILSILSDLNVKATFFVTGAGLEKHMSEGEKIVASGHELGNHSYSHKRMIFKSIDFVQKEIEKTDSLIKGVGYQGDIHFRPPFGKKLFILPYYLRNHNRKNVMWDVEPESYPEVAESAEKITQYVLENTKPGSIILLHVMFKDGKESVKSIKGIVSGLKQQGYSFKTVSELLHKSKTSP
jgi:peptidoglycan-N-acetylglucosamine deacetylase